MQTALRAILDDIHHHAELARRDPATITLVAVSKTFSSEHIRRAFDLGIRDFGESRLDEAAAKMDALPPEICQAITWHFIGKLQSRKVRDVARLFSVVHTLESASQLRQFSKVESPIDALIEVNTGREPQKAGVLPEELDSYLSLARSCPGVQVRGLMTMGPVRPDAESMRPFFRELRHLGCRIGANAWLSMGMSADFGVAIQEGSTHIRVGSRLFGDRA